MTGEITLCCLYTTQNELLRHYSTKIFYARMAILTAAAGLIGLALGVRQFDPPPDGNHPDLFFGLMPQQFIILVTPALLAALWTMENGYFKKYNMLLISLRKIEPKFEGGGSDSSGHYFSSYVPFTHWAFYAGYLILLTAFVVWTCFAGVFAEEGLYLCIGIWVFTILLVSAAIVQMRHVAQEWRRALNQTDRTLVVRLLTWAPFS